ncbi:TetR/AcrR family transcriptional regulator [uncultured Jatrophihabitans sp.]|uniref:TetR/AcrR family transcriptional regulator n=1 Tax=uncultured Jatrophihabitans sp. TaxID=1610747 RepID=UPI0035CB2FD0
MTLMAARGIAAVSTRDIANAAGVPQATIHYLFGSRDELLRAITEALTDTVCQRIIDSAGRSDTVQGALRDIVDALVLGVADESQRHLLLLELTIHALRNPELRDLAQWQYGRYEQASLHVLDELCQQTGTEFTGAPTVAVRFILATLDGFTVQQLIDTDPKVAEAGLSQLAELVAGMFSPSRRRTTPPT